MLYGKPRSGGPNWGRLSLIAVVGVLLFGLVVSATYAGLIWWELGQIQDPTVTIIPQEGQTFAPAPGVDEPLVVPDIEETVGRTNILIVGSDSREGLTDAQLAEIGTEDVGTDLTDTIILLQIDPETDGAAMLSFPRDLLVERCDGSLGKINSAFFIGEQQEEGRGPECLVSTISAMTRIQIDHYVRVNLAGFVDAVDALGGVEFYLDAPIRDRFAGLDVPQGCVEFDGVTALQFVRARSIDSDFGRIARQQRFAREMLDQAASLQTLVNPARVAALISSISEVIETDSGFGASEMVELATSVRNISSGRVDTRTVPGFDSRFGEDDAAVIRPLDEQAEALYAAFRTGDLLPEDVGVDAAPITLGPPNVIPIVVQNGSGRDGLADQTAAVLESLGYRVEETGTAENYGFSASLVLYPETRQDHADVLAESLGGVSTNNTTRETDTLTLILGSDFDPEEFAPEDFDPEAVEEGPTVPLDTPTDTSEFTGATQSEVSC
ncbi:LCP family protein [Euzebya tangerina]|uniref:LCP family protein n=1 Tax=Euzebya tangerina TaxID=591198 RepID=UPI002F350D4C